MNISGSIAHIIPLRMKVSITLIMVLILAFGFKPGVSQEDLRAFQHGLSLVQINSQSCYVIWSSAGIPPVYKNGQWTHDIYYSLITKSNPKINPVKIIAFTEAQEPASAAITDNGTIMITTEDGWDADREVAQRFGVYDKDMHPIRDYPQMVYDGGHSGHVAAIGNRFAVFFSDGWISGGGVDNLGTGDDVLVKIYNSNGLFEKKIAIAVDPENRDWWPIIASSREYALLLWQRLDKNQSSADLYFAILNPATGKLLHHPDKLAAQVKFYTYNVTYIPAIERFLVTGTYRKGGGFAFLLDNDGKVITSNKHIPATVREAGLIIRPGQSINEAVVVQPVSPSGLMILTIKKNLIKLSQTIANEYLWQSMGTRGVFIDTNQIYIVSLSTAGMVEQKISIPALLQ